MDAPASLVTWPRTTTGAAQAGLPSTSSQTRPPPQLAVGLASSQLLLAVQATITTELDTITATENNVRGFSIRHSLRADDCPRNWGDCRRMSSLMAKAAPRTINGRYCF